MTEVYLVNEVKQLRSVSAHHPFTESYLQLPDYYSREDTIFLCQDGTQLIPEKSVST
jgi:hypothetical protein